jgi:hypothetical protein
MDLIAGDLECVRARSRTSPDVITAMDGCARDEATARKIAMDEKSLSSLVACAADVDGVDYVVDAGPDVHDVQPLEVHIEPVVVVAANRGSHRHKRAEVPACPRI